MNDRARFAQDVGLDGCFEEAFERWEEGNAARACTHVRGPATEPREVVKLRERWSKAQARWWNHHSPTAERLQTQLAELLRVLSPTWVPPRESEVDAGAAPIRRVLIAVEAAISAIAASESAATPWYLQTIEALGIESTLNRDLGPGMAMRSPTAADDPLPRLLVTRSLLSSYLERIECQRASADVGVPMHRVVYESIVIALRRAKVSAPAIANVLQAKGYSTDETKLDRINSTVQKLRNRGVALPELPRGRPRT